MKIPTCFKGDSHRGKFKRNYSSKAKQSTSKLNELIEEYKSWILRCASETAHHHISDTDNEYKVALIAFAEAVQSYDEEQGPFKVFATIVIRRRVLGYIRVHSQADIFIETYEKNPIKTVHKCKILGLDDGDTGKSSLIERIVHGSFVSSSLPTDEVKDNKMGYHHGKD